MNWLILRGLLVDGQPDAPTKSFRAGLKIYPPAQAANPPTMNVISVWASLATPCTPTTSISASEIAEVFARAPVDFIDSELRGLAACTGFRRGQPFAPEPRMKAILDDATAVGNATARALGFQTRDPGWVADEPGRIRRPHLRSKQP